MIDIIEITKASMSHTFSTNGIAIITAIKPTSANYQLDRANGVSSTIMLELNPLSSSFCFPVYKDDTLTMISVATVNANEHAHIYFIACIIK